MSFEASTAAVIADVETFIDPTPAPLKLALPANDPADPELGWAARNPERAMAFLFVSPRDCAAIDELMAL